MTDADVSAARAAVLEALERGDGKVRVVELLLDWHRIVQTQDLQLDDVDLFPRLR